MRRTAITLGLLLSACADTPAPSPVPSWLGPAPHLAAAGQVDGAAVDVVLDGAAAADALALHCRRYYEAPLVGATTLWDQGRLFRFEVEAALSLPDGPRLLLLVFDGHDAQRDAPGTTVAIVPPDDQALGAEDVRFDWAWLGAADRAIAFEDTAEDGTFEVDLFSGTPDAGGLVIPADDGVIGGRVVAHWTGADRIALSFSAPCTANQVERIIQGGG